MSNVHFDYLRPHTVLINHAINMWVESEKESISCLIVSNIYDMNTNYIKQIEYYDHYVNSSVCLLTDTVVELDNSTRCHECYNI